MAGARRELHVPLLAVRELQHDPRGPGALFKDAHLNEVAQTTVLWLRRPPAPAREEAEEASRDKGAEDSEEGSEQAGAGAGSGEGREGEGRGGTAAASGGGGKGRRLWGCIQYRSQRSHKSDEEAQEEGAPPAVAEDDAARAPEGHIALINLCPVPTFHFQLRRAWAHAHKQAITTSIVRQRWQLAASRSRTGLGDVARRAETLAGLNLAIPSSRGEAERDPFAGISRLVADRLRQDFNVLQSGIARPSEVLSGRDAHCMRLLVRTCLSRKSRGHRAKAVLCASSPVLWSGVVSTFTNLAVVCLSPLWRDSRGGEARPPREKVPLFDAELGVLGGPGAGGGGSWVEAVGDVVRCRERLDIWMPVRTATQGLKSSIVWGQTGLEDVERWQKTLPSSRACNGLANASLARATAAWGRLYLRLLRAAAFSKLRLAVSTTRALLKGRHVQSARIWFPDIGGAEPWGSPALWAKTGVHIWAEEEYNRRGPPKGRVGGFAGLLFALIASEKADLPLRWAAVEWADGRTPALREPAGSEWREFVTLACEALYELQGCIEVANSTGLTSSGVLGHVIASLDPSLRRKAACRLFLSMMCTVRESKQHPGTVTNAQWEHAYHIASLMEAVMRSPLAETLVLGDIALEFLDSLSLDPWLRKQSTAAARSVPGREPGSNFWEAQMLPKYARLCQAVLAWSKGQETVMPWERRTE